MEKFSSSANHLLYTFFPKVPWSSHIVDHKYYGNPLCFLSFFLQHVNVIFNHKIVYNHLNKTKSIRKNNGNSWNKIYPFRMEIKPCQTKYTLDTCTFKNLIILKEKLFKAPLEYIKNWNYLKCTGKLFHKCCPNKSDSV